MRSRLSSSIKGLLRSRQQKWTNSYTYQHDNLFSWSSEPHTIFGVEIDITRSGNGRDFVRLGVSLFE